MLVQAASRAEFPSLFTSDHVSGQFGRLSAKSVLNVFVVVSIFA